MGVRVRVCLCMCVLFPGLFWLVAVCIIVSVLLGVLYDTVILATIKRKVALGEKKFLENKKRGINAKLNAYLSYSIYMANNDQRNSISRQVKVFVRIFLLLLLLLLLLFHSKRLMAKDHNNNNNNNENKNKKQQQ